MYNERTARLQDSKKTIRYSPSGSELLFEQICESFGTELLPAYVNPINGEKLVRVSRPVTAINKKTGKERLVQFQYTRFSPACDPEWLGIYRKNAGKPGLSTEEIYREVEAKIGKWNPLRVVTDKCYIPNVPLHRFRKSFYAGVYPEKETRKPFEIHRPRGSEDVWIHLSRQPLYSVRYHRKPPENEFDEIRFAFPSLFNAHRGAAEHSTALHRLSLKDGEYITKDEFSLHAIKHIHYDASPTLPMSFIQHYLLDFCCGRAL